MARRDWKALHAQRLTDPNFKEAIRQSLYDTLSFDSGATTSLRFFSTPQGGTKTKADTNMTLAGQIPKRHKFVADGIEIHIAPGSSAAAYVRQDPVRQNAAVAAPHFANDVWALGEAGWLEVLIGSKTYLIEGPLYRFPPQNGIDVRPAAAVENTNTTVLNQITSDYARFSGRPYVLAPELPIDENTNFEVTVNWPAAFALPSGFDAKLKLVLLGTLFRN